MITFDTIVVGSGATGAMAAQTLVEAGATVLVLDGGIRDTRYASLVPPEKSFVEIRRTDDEQHRYLLGDEFESAIYRKLGAGAQLTPPRRYIVERVNELLPAHAEGFAPVESLAFGGLAGGWGLLCGVYSGAELARASLPEAAMREAYQTVADRIGICGAADDDARPYTYGDLHGVQPPVPLDPTAMLIERRYYARRAAYRRDGYHFGRPALALLTQAKDGRRATPLHEMEFYADAERAAWRPAWTLEALGRAPNFAYHGGMLVTRFVERDDGVEVAAHDLGGGGGEQRFACRRLVLCCGALGTARIVLRSLGGDNTRLPLLCNPYTYVPCIVPARIGRAMPERENPLVQLVGFHDPGESHDDVAVATLFAYRSLMLFRLLRETPLAVRDARALMQYLLSGLLLAGIDHPQARSEGKELWLRSDPSSPTGDALTIDFALTESERRRCEVRERGFLRALRGLGAWPVKRVRPPLGASIHYAGTLPFDERETPFTLAPDGRVRGSRAVYAADGSGFTFLPAKGLTLSLMANAHRVARQLGVSAAAGTD
jgi:hypothetical protein